MIGDTPMIREVEANLKATGVKVLDIEILRLKPDMRAINGKPFFETGARLGATQVFCAWTTTTFTVWKITLPNSAKSRIPSV